jgi:hypothetical protein
MMLRTGSITCTCHATCTHSFGANLYSYARVQRMMADRLGGVVTAHDAPGFGLTGKRVGG